MGRKPGQASEGVCDCQGRHEPTLRVLAALYSPRARWRTTGESDAIRASRSCSGSTTRRAAGGPRRHREPLRGRPLHPHRARARARAARPAPDRLPGPPRAARGRGRGGAPPCRRRRRSPAGVAVKIPLDRIDDRHKLARLVETGARRRRGAGRRRALPRARRRGQPARRRDVRVRAPQAPRRRRASTSTVEYAANGHDALAPARRAAAHRPRHGRPLHAGDGRLHARRADARDPALLEIPILVISAGAADARARALDLGVDVYLQKPVQFADIIATVRTLLADTVVAPARNAERPPAAAGGRVTAQVRERAATSCPSC